MADKKVPALLHKMSVAAQKAWYKKNKMEYPGASGAEGKSAAQAKKDVGEINKKKAREAAIAKAAAMSKKNKELVSSSERVRAMRKNADTWGGGLGGGLDRNRDIISYVRAGGTIKAGRLGEEKKESNYPGQKTQRDHLDRYRRKPQEDWKTKQDREYGLATGYKAGRWAFGGKYEEVEKVEEGKMKDIATDRAETERLLPFTPDKKKVRRGLGGPMSQVKWLAKQAMMKKAKELQKEEYEIIDFSAQDWNSLSEEEKAEYIDIPALEEAMTPELRKAVKMHSSAKKGASNYEIAQDKGGANKSQFGTSARDSAAAAKVVRKAKKVIKKAAGDETYARVVKNADKGSYRRNVGSLGEEVVLEEPQSEADKGEYDYEGDMAKSQLRSILANAKRLHDMLEENTNLPEWVQSKITLAQDYILTAASYMEGEMNEEFTDEKLSQIDEKAMSDTQMKKREKYVKSMKPVSDWEKRYPGRGEQVMYATATKMAMKEEAEVVEETTEEVEQIEEKYMGFKALKASIAAKGNVRDPGAVAAAIGRKKYGKEKFQAMAAAGKKANEEVEQVAEAEGKVAVTPKEKELAAHHGDKTKITYGDVIKARLKSAAEKAMKAGK